MIDDLDRTVGALLQRELPANILSQVAITFATPADDFPPHDVTLPAINLFLHDIRENRQLRDADWAVQIDAKGAATRERRPIRVDCSYLVTAWPSKSSTTPALDEHQLLGATLKALLRHPVLPEAILVGAIAGSGVETPTTALQQGQLQDISSFWQALGGRPRAAFGYTVTIALQPFDVVPAGKPVTDSRLVFDTAPALGSQAGRS